jgi:hypothetical protein
MTSDYTQSDYGKFVDKSKYYKDVFYSGNIVSTFRDIYLSKALNMMHLNILYRIFLYLIVYDEFSFERNKYLNHNLVYDERLVSDILRFLSIRKKSLDVFIDLTLTG